MTNNNLSHMKVLIVRNDKLGDFTLSLPVFHAIKKHNESIRTIALVSPMNAEFARQINSIDEVIVDDKSSFLKICKTIKEINPDVAITLYSTFRIGLLLFLSGVKKRIAPATKLAQLFYNVKIVQRRSKCKKREYEYNLDLLKGFNVQIDSGITYPVIPIERSDQERALDKFKKQYAITKDYSYVAFHPGYGGSSLGLLNVDEYIELARIVAAYKGFKSVFTFGPDETYLKEKVKQKINFDAILHLSLDNAYEFCKLLSNFSLFVSTSTGTMQLAGAVNIHTLSFFGDVLASSPARWAPLNSEERQFNFTLPADTGRRRDIFEEIKNTLRHFIETCK